MRKKNQPGNPCCDGCQEPEPPVPPPDCESCATGTASNEIQLVISGFSGSGANGPCNVVNGTYVLPYVVIGTLECRWRLTDIALAPCGGSLQVNLNAIVAYQQFGVDGAGWYLTVTIEEIQAFQPPVTFESRISTNPFATPPDCSTWSNLPITFRSNPTCCTHDGSAVLVTAL